MDKDFIVSPKNLKRDAKLDDPLVSPILKRKTKVILKELRNQGYPAVVIQTVRTVAQGAYNKLKGTSKTGTKSRHIPKNNKSGLCEAVDIAFENAKGQITWDVPLEWWKKLGNAFKSHGMTWGGDWHSLRDYNHGEL